MGDHLVFFSNRSFSPTYGDMDWEMVYKDLANLYAMTLKQNGKAFFPYRSDESVEVKTAPTKQTRSRW